MHVGARCYQHNDVAWAAYVEGKRKRKIEEERRTDKEESNERGRKIETRGVARKGWRWDSRARRCAQTAQGRGFPLRPIGSTSECAHLRYHRLAARSPADAMSWRHISLRRAPAFMVTTYCRLATVLPRESHSRNSVLEILFRYVKLRSCGLTYPTGYISRTYRRSKNNSQYP